MREILTILYGSIKSSEIWRIRRKLRIAGTIKGNDIPYVARFSYPLLYEKVYLPSNKSDFQFKTLYWMISKEQPAKYQGLSADYWNHVHESENRCELSFHHHKTQKQIKSEFQ